MNSTITFPPIVPEPTLKLPRSSEKWVASLAEERRRLLEDQEALREREQNLHDYEMRLRGLQAEIEAGRATPANVRPAPAPAIRSNTPFLRPSSQTPFVDDPVLKSAWEKMHRAREILEAEQKNLRDDRIALQELEKQLKRRDEALAAREAKLAAREALVATTTSPEPAADEKVSAVTRITRAPFEMARSVFCGKKK